jgi:nicotinate-nucleotide adenylyltransferase
MADSIAAIGILGGTFDPIHYGHLRLAEEAADACALARVRLIPAALPNLRSTPRTPAQHRLEMARLAAAGNARLEVDGRELLREGTSYTVDTLESLRTELGPQVPLCLILGADAFLRLPSWSRWPRLFDLAHVVVASRPGYDLNGPARLSTELGVEWRRRRTTNPMHVHVHPAGSIASIEIPLLEISASAVRTRIARQASVRYLLPPAVLDYISEHNLYET